MNERDQEGEPQISPLRACGAPVEMTNFWLTLVHWLLCLALRGKFGARDDAFVGMVVAARSSNFFEAIACRRSPAFPAIRRLERCTVFQCPQSRPKRGLDGLALLSAEMRGGERIPYLAAEPKKGLILQLPQHASLIGQAKGEGRAGRFSSLISAIANCAILISFSQ